MKKKRTLLLNANYEPLTFLTEKRALTFLAKEFIDNDKVEIISTWNDSIEIYNKNINFPAILKLKKQIKRSYKPLSFSRKELIKRDNNLCQFCSKKIYGSEITVDHIVPKSKGGETSFLNCVIACLPCNSKKANLSLDESGLKLIKKPIHPVLYSHDPFRDRITSWHEDWNFYYYR